MNKVVMIAILTAAVGLFRDVRCLSDEGGVSPIGVTLANPPTGLNVGANAPAAPSPTDGVHGWSSIPGKKVVLLIHGGCGVIPRSEMSAERERAHREVLETSLRAGYAALQQPNSTSLDGVVEAVKVLEDSPLFNAGKGAVFTREGKKMVLL